MGFSDPSDSSDLAFDDDDEDEDDTPGRDLREGAGRWAGSGQPMEAATVLSGGRSGAVVNGSSSLKCLQVFANPCKRVYHLTGRYARE